MLAVFVLLLASFCAKKRISPPKAQDGVLDLRGWDFFRDGNVKLNGEWEFFWQRLLSEEKGQKQKGERLLLEVPGIWNDAQIEGKALPGDGYGTYRLRLLLPEGASHELALRTLDAGTSYRVFVNGERVAGSGRVASDPNKAVPSYLPRVSRILRLSGETEILVEVANFSHRKGGLWESLFLGRPDQIRRMVEQAVRTDLFLAGSFVIMSLYHIGLFLLRRTEKSSLYFALFGICVTLRLLTTGERFLFTSFPELDWEIGQKIEYLSTYLAPAFLGLFLTELYPQQMSRRIMNGFLFAFGILGLGVLLLPVRYYSQSVPVWNLTVLFGGIWVMTVILRAARRSREAWLPFFGYFVFFLAVLNDILYENGALMLGRFMPVGLFVFVFSQAALLSVRFSMAFRKIERLGRDLRVVNHAYARFVPVQFLGHLQKESIMDVQLGDHVERHMTVLFSDIRGFTSFSEKISPEQTFAFLNAYFKRMAPIIQSHDGFIDKFIGDAIMALFAGSSTEAVQAAIKMFRSLEDYNRDRRSLHREPISIGVGLHTGEMILGTVGDAKRMEPTVISDAVNLASRIENLTKKLGAPLLISEDTSSGLMELPHIHLRYQGEVQVRGKERRVVLYEVLNAHREHKIQPLLDTKGLFEEGVLAQVAGRRRQAYRIFKKVLKENPEDLSASLRLESLKERRKEWKLDSAHSPT